MLIEHREPGIKPARKRVGTEQSRAEAVDRGDRRRLGRARGVLRAPLPQARADPLTQLACSLLRERDRKDGADIRAAVLLDRRELLRGEGGAHPAQQTAGWRQPSREHVAGQGVSSPRASAPAIDTASRSTPASNSANASGSSWSVEYACVQTPASVSSTPRGRRSRPVSGW